MLQRTLIATALALTSVTAVAATEVNADEATADDAPEWVQQAVDIVEQAIDDAGIEPIEGSSDWIAQTATPIDLEDGIEMAPGIDVHVDVDVDDDRAIHEGVALYGDDEVSVAVEVGEDETRLAVVIESSDAPTEFDFDVDLGAGESLAFSEAGDEVRIINAEGDSILNFSPAWAVDAAGNEVATHYELRGSTIVQVVDHAGAEYPVTADPTGDCGWTTCTVRFSKSETSTIASGGWGYATFTALCARVHAGAGVACGIVFATIWWHASNAKNDGRCLHIKYARYGVPAAWPGTYGGSRCR